MDVNCTYCRDHSTIYITVKYLCCTPETAMMVYVSYMSTFLKRWSKRPRGWTIVNPTFCYPDPPSGLRNYCSRCKDMTRSPLRKVWFLQNQTLGPTFCDVLLLKNLWRSHWVILKNCPMPWACTGSLCSASGWEQPRNDLSAHTLVIQGAVSQWFSHSIKSGWCGLGWGRFL